MEPVKRKLVTMEHLLKAHNEIPGHECKMKEHQLCKLYVENLSCWQKAKCNYLELICYSPDNPRNFLERIPFRSRKQILLEKEAHINSYWWIIHPLSQFCVYHQLVMLPFLFISIFASPISASFVGVLRGRTYRIISYFGTTLEWFLTVNFVYFSLLTGYVDNCLIVLEPRRILKNYLLSRYFITDLLPAIDANSVARWTTYYQFFDFLALLRAFRIPTLLAYIDRMAQYFQMKNKTYAVYKFILIISIMFDWMACAYYLVPTVKRLVYDMKDFDKLSWITIEGGLKDSLFIVQYTAALFECASYFFGAHPITNNAESIEEYMLEIFAIAWGVIVRLIIIVILLAFLLQRDKHEVKYYVKTSQLKGFMHQQETPLDVRQKCLTYYDYKYKRKYFNESNVILSDKLKRDINRHMCEKLVRSVDLFSDLPSEILKDVLLYLKHEIYSPNDEVIIAGSIGDSMYFIASGTVAVYTPSMEEMCHLRAGSYFGEISLLMKNKLRTATIVAIDICELYKLTKEAFKKCFRNRPEILRKVTDTAKKRYEEMRAREQYHYSASPSKAAKFFSANRAKDFPDKELWNFFRFLKWSFLKHLDPNEKESYFQSLKLYRLFL